jgi:long-chain acyl-CoA synthetase
LGGVVAGGFVPDSAVAAGDDIHNLSDAVRRAAQAHPDTVALVHARADGDRRTTWAELDALAEAVANNLRALLAQPGDQRLAQPGDQRLAQPGDQRPGDQRSGNQRYPARVAVALPNVPEFALAMFGALRAGLVVVPVNPSYTGRELRHVLSDSAASVLVGTAAVLAQLSTPEAPTTDGPTSEVRIAELPALAHIFAVSAIPGARPFADLMAPTQAEPASGVPATGGEDLAALMYTSGTAGAPKGAMLSHRALIANHRQLDQLRPAVITETDVVLLAQPLCHAFGFNSGLGAVAWHGATGVLVDTFEPDAMLDTIARQRVTVLSGVPQMYAAWGRAADARTRLASVRLAVSGAAPLDPVLAAEFRQVTGHQIHEGYGLTETAPVLTTALASPAPKARSIGRPLPGVEVRLVAADGSQLAWLDSAGLVEADLVGDFDDDAGDAPGTDPGEIVVRGANLFDGYWPNVEGGPDPDGWWATADVAYADADGDLFLVDRLGELIIVSGFNVYPHEVELVLAGVPAVVEAAVVGGPDARTGQCVKAYVVVGEPVTREDLMAHCARNLARFKLPTTIDFVTELPHSITGKVRKATLREAS